MPAPDTSITSTRPATIATAAPFGFGRASGAGAGAAELSRPAVVMRRATVGPPLPARPRGPLMPGIPTVLFVCVHNAGRSQMAAGYLQTLAGGRIRVLSAGSEPADRINPAAVAVMAEEGIDITANAPRLLTPQSVRESEVVITMGCGDTCPIFPGKRYEDWDVADPAGQPLAVVREIRDDIQARVTTLLRDILH